MRRTLDALFNISGGIAAVFMVLLLCAVLLSVVSREVGFNVPGIDMYAGYMMAGAGFLALAHTLKRGEHIRVTLVLQWLKPETKRIFEMASLAVAAVLSALLAWYSVRLCYQSFALNDISTGSDATPLWIPQISMALGTVILFVAIVDELILEIQGKRIVVVSGESLRNE
jgi:TRAP-type C4-dicarboxylate transport system permease small subunit